MSDEPQQEIHAVTTGGMASSHPSQMSLPVLVGPATEDESHALRDGLQPVACWRMDDIRFEFDSSFVGPRAADELKEADAAKELLKVLERQRSR